MKTILISPRRWGKSSLVAKAAKSVQAKSKKTIFCMIDLNNIRSEEQFYKLLATKVLHDREIIDIVGKKIDFMDPLYKYWLKNYYFESE